MTTATAPRTRTAKQNSTGVEISIYRTMSDSQLTLAVDAMERQLDKLDDATYPSAGIEREHVLDALAAVRAEVERRRT